MHLELETGTCNEILSHGASNPNRTVKTSTLVLRINQTRQCCLVLSTHFICCAEKELCGDGSLENNQKTWRTEEHFHFLKPVPPQSHPLERKSHCYSKNLHHLSTALGTGTQTVKVTSTPFISEDLEKPSQFSDFSFFPNRDRIRTLWKKQRVLSANWPSAHKYMLDIEKLQAHRNSSLAVRT